MWLMSNPATELPGWRNGPSLGPVPRTPHALCFATVTVEKRFDWHQSMAPTLVPPPHSNELKVTFPEDHVLLLTLNRPKSLNAMTPQMTEDLKRVLDWFEEEPELW